MRPQRWPVFVILLVFTAVALSPSMAFLSPAHQGGSQTTKVFLPLLTKPGLDLPYADGPGTAYRASVPPSGSDDFGSAAFSLWIPGGVPVVRGLMIYAPGCGGASSLTDEPSRTRATLARKWHLGFVGMQFTDKAGGRACGWSRTTSGSPEALQRALTVFSQQAGRPELVHAPYLFFGVSGGSGWSTGLALRNPERTYAVFARGFGPGGVIPEAARGVPMLLNGAPDGSYGTAASFQNCRAQQALCALNLDPNGEPSLGNQWDRMALPYFDAVLRQRMPPESPIAGQVTLRSTDQAKSWLGSRSGFTIASAASFTGDPLQASWLPDEGFAKRWQEYNTRGALTPWTP